MCALWGQVDMIYECALTEEESRSKTYFVVCFQRSSMNRGPNIWLFVVFWFIILVTGDEAKS